jgi:hypothetical protein
MRRQHNDCSLDPANRDFSARANAVPHSIAALFMRGSGMVCDSSCLADLLTTIRGTVMNKVLFGTFFSLVAMSSIAHAAQYQCASRGMYPGWKSYVVEAASLAEANRKAIKEHPAVHKMSCDFNPLPPTSAASEAAPTRPSQPSKTPSSSQQRQRAADRANTAQVATRNASQTSEAAAPLNCDNPSSFRDTIGCARQGGRQPTSAAPPRRTSQAAPVDTPAPAAQTPKGPDCSEVKGFVEKAKCYKDAAKALGQ